MQITSDVIMEQLESIFTSWCEDCPEKSVSRGASEGGLAIEPDEDICPCDFDIGDRKCAMRQEYANIEEKAAELAELINSAAGVC